MATQTIVKGKVENEIESLEREEADIEDQIKKGFTTPEMGAQKQREVRARLERLKKNARSDGSKTDSFENKNKQEDNNRNDRKTEDSNKNRDTVPKAFQDAFSSNSSLDPTKPPIPSVFDDALKDVDLDLQSPDQKEFLTQIANNESGKESYAPTATPSPFPTPKQNDPKTPRSQSSDRKLGKSSSVTFDESEGNLTPNISEERAHGQEIGQILKSTLADVNKGTRMKPPVPETSINGSDESLTDLNTQETESSLQPPSITQREIINPTVSSKTDITTPVQSPTTPSITNAQTDAASSMRTPISSTTPIRSSVKNGSPNQPTKVSTAKKTAPPQSLRNNPNRSVKAAPTDKQNRVLFYSGVGNFLNGTLSSRSKQRELAIEQTKTIGKNAINTPQTQKAEPSKKRSAANNDPGKNQQRKTSLRTKISKILRQTTDKKSTPKNLSSKKIFKSFSGFKLSNPFKKTSQKSSPKAPLAKYSDTKTASKITQPNINQTKITTPAPTGGVLKNISRITLPKLGHRDGPTRPKQQTITPIQPKQHVSANKYQEQWNKSKIQLAQLTGYNRFALVQKVLKSKAISMGKFLTSPMPTPTPKVNSQDEKERQRSQAIQPYKNQPQSNMRTVIRLSKGFSTNTAVRRAGRPAPSNTGFLPGNSFKPSNAANSIVSTGVRKLGSWVILNPPVLTGVVVILSFCFVVMVVIIAVSSDTGSASAQPENTDPSTGVPPSGPTINPIPGFTLSLSGTPSLDTCENITSPTCIIEYTIRYTYSTSSPVPLESITIYNNIPPSTTFENATGDYHQDGNSISWPLDRVNNQTTLTLKVRPKTNNIRVANSVFATTTYTGGSGNLSNILPSSIESSETVDAAQQEAVRLVSAAPNLIASYQDVERATGVPWQILAGIHYREGDLNPNLSLASGRQIGDREPDIEAGGGCNSTYIAGEPVALPGGGCGFRTFTDSAIFAANHLKGKNGGTVPASFQELTKSLAYYNGYPGNSNCYHNTPYPNCPEQFPGEDNNYVMSLFDMPHEIMYIIYCGDGLKCVPPNRDPKLGVASVVMGLNRFYTNTQ